VEAQQEQQRRKAEQHQLTSLRVPSNLSGGSSKPARAAVVLKKALQTYEEEYRAGVAAKVTQMQRGEK